MNYVENSPAAGNQGGRATAVRAGGFRAVGINAAARSVMSAILMAAVPVAISLFPGEALAQRGAPMPRQIIGINPLGIAGGLYTGEYELAVDGQMSIGFSASHVDFDHTRFTSFDARWRLYLDRVLEGVAFGLTAGVGKNTDESDIEEGATAGWGLTVGSNLDYQWILGADRRFALGVGTGFKRFVTRGGEGGNGPKVWPTMRLTVGVAF